MPIGRPILREVGYKGRICGARNTTVYLRYRRSRTNRNIADEENRLLRIEIAQIHQFARCLLSYNQKTYLYCKVHYKKVLTRFWQLNLRMRTILQLLLHICL